MQGERDKQSVQQGLRYNQGKLRWSLVDFPSLESAVRVLEYGATKYEPDNWKRGLHVKGMVESLLRHTFAFLNGEDLDAESGQSHIGHVICNAMYIEYMMNNKPEFDDRDGTLLRQKELGTGKP